MEIMTHAISPAAYAKAALRCRVPAVTRVRFTGGVRLLADGGASFVAPSGPPLLT